MSDADERVKALYPFLGEDSPAGERLSGPESARSDPVAAADAVLAGLAESARRKAADSAEVKQAFFAQHADEVVAAARAIAGVYGQGGRMFAMGNGGSSCDAAHFVVEFMHPVTTGRPALPAINLGGDAATSSAVANDVGAAHVFVRQLAALAGPGDGLIGFSTSGNSANLLAAFEAAKEKAMVTVGLTGGTGGAMAASGAVDHCLTVASDSVHRVQETHVAVYHVLWDLVHTLLSKHRGRHGHGARS